MENVTGVEGLQLEAEGAAAPTPTRRVTSEEKGHSLFDRGDELRAAADRFENESNEDEKSRHRASTRAASDVLSRISVM